ncbi:MAG TPA: ABC transporter substrate-binding protein [Thermodesulfobacteriota bacterium]
MGLVGRPGMDRRAFLAGAGAAAVTMAAGARIGAAQAKTIKIGAIHPVSGVLAQVGQACRQGAQLAVAEINRAGGIRSKDARLELLVGDSESKAEVGAAEAERLIREGAQIIIGAFQSDVVMAIAQVCERREVPFVVDVGAADQITTSGFTKVFRIFPTTSALGKNGAAYLAEIIRLSGAQVERAVVTYTKDLFGTVVSKAFLQAMEAAKSPVKIVEVIGYDLTVQDLSTEVARIKAARPDVLLPFNRIRDSVMLVRELYKQRVPLKGILSPGSPGWYEKEFIEQTGPLGEFAMDAPPWYNPKSPLHGRVEAAFRRAYDRGVDTNSGYSYEGIVVAADALERAKSLDPAGIVAALRTTSIKDHLMAGGPITFDAQGQNVNASTSLIQVQKRRPVVVLPDAEAEARPVFPAPGWDERT